MLLKDGSISIHHKNIQTLAIEMYIFKKRKKEKDIASEIISNIFCLQKQCQHDLRQQTDFNETDHNSERYRT